MSQNNTQQQSAKAENGKAKLFCKKRVFLVAVAVAVLTGKAAVMAAPLSLGDGFMSPPKENYPSMWVFKLGVDSPREVITYDLEEFTKVGISDFMIIGTGAAFTAAKPYGEPALKGEMHGVRADRLRWALHEANRLGLGVWIMLGPPRAPRPHCGKFAEMIQSQRL